MERYVLLFGFVQYLWLFVHANSDFNGTLVNNCIGIDMAKIEEYTRTLPTPESFINSTLNAEETHEKLLPFGDLRSDWARLHLLHDALPEESDLKKIFKHLYRLLLIAYEEATRVQLPQNITAEIETTESVFTKEEKHILGVDKKKPVAEQESILNSTGQSHKAEVKLEELQITVSLVYSKDETDAALGSTVSNFITFSPNPEKDEEHSVFVKNDKQLTKAENGESTNVRADIPDLETLFKSSTIMNLGDRCANCTVREESSTFIDTTTASDEEIILTTSQKGSTNAASSNHSLTALTISSLENNPIGKLMNSTEQKEEQNKEVTGIKPSISFSTEVFSTTETMTKEKLYKTLRPVENLPGETFLDVTEATNFTPGEQNFNPTQEESFNTSSYRALTEKLPEEETLNINEPSLATIFNKQSLKNLLSSTTLKEDLLILPKKEENISLGESPVTTILEEQYSTHEDDSLGTTISSYEILDNIFLTSHDDYSPATTGSSYTTKNSDYFTSSQKKDKPSVSAKNETLSAESTTVRNPAETLEEIESPLWNTTSENKTAKESTLSETHSENPWGLNLPSSESVGSTVVELKTPSSFVKFYTEKNVEFTTDSTGDASFGAVQNNNELTLTTLSRGIEFLTSEKSSEKEEHVLSSTSSPTLTFVSSSISTVTESSTDQQLTTIIVAKESNIAEEEQKSNEANSSTDKSSIERIPTNLNIQNTGRTTEKYEHSRKTTDESFCITNVPPIFNDTEGTTEKNEDISNITVLDNIQSMTEENEGIFITTGESDDKTIFPQVPNNIGSAMEEDEHWEQTTDSAIIKNPSQIQNDTGKPMETNEEIEKSTSKTNGMINSSQSQNKTENQPVKNREIEKTTIKTYDINLSQIHNNNGNKTETNEDIEKTTSKTNNVKNPLQIQDKTGNPMKTNEEIEKTASKADGMINSSQIQNKTENQTAKNKEIEKTTIKTYDMNRSQIHDNIGSKTETNKDIEKTTSKTNNIKNPLQIQDKTENPMKTNEEIEKTTSKTNGLINSFQIQNKTENQTAKNTEIESTTIKTYDINLSQIHDNTGNKTETNKDIEKTARKTSNIKNPLQIQDKTGNPMKTNEEIETKKSKTSDITNSSQIQNSTKSRTVTNQELENITIKTFDIKNPSRIQDNTENRTVTNEETKNITIKTFDIKNSSKIRNNKGNFTEPNEEMQRPTIEPVYIKNPLVTGSPRSNHISRDFKHASGKAETSKNSESPQVIPYDSGSGAKIENVWRPHDDRERPVGNNIWRLNSFPAKSQPYVYQRSRSSAASKTKDLVDSKIPAKSPFADTMNSLRSKKRNSANADTQKQRISFYRQSENNNSSKSRSNDNRNTNATIRCKSAQ